MPSADARRRLLLENPGGSESRLPWAIPPSSTHIKVVSWRITCRYDPICQNGVCPRQLFKGLDLEDPRFTHIITYQGPGVSIKLDSSQ
jgi:hypothetical protein